MAVSVRWWLWAQGCTLPSPSVWVHQHCSLQWRQKDLFKKQIIASKRHLHSAAFLSTVPLSSDYDDERGAWTKAELVKYVMRNESWWRNGFLNMTEPSELSYLHQSKLCVLPVY